MPNTPGVYITETNAFPNQIAQVETAIPAFLGYTEKAPGLHLPTRITSLADFEAQFGTAPPTRYSLSNAHAGFTVTATHAHFLLYYSLKHFYANGGSICYIVSVGNYKAKPSLTDFFSGASENGLKALRTTRQVTLVLAPDAMLLSEADCAQLQRHMLQHCAEMGNCFAVLDVWAGYNSRSATPDPIDAFRKGIGAENLKWGAAYYPWVHTNISNADPINFSHLDAEGLQTLSGLLHAELKASLANKAISPKIAIIIEDTIRNMVARHPVVEEVHQPLLKVSALYQSVMQQMLTQRNLLPPAAGAAGVYTFVDTSKGVFKASANVALQSVLQPAVFIDDAAQQDLNAPIDGKAVNAIRTFIGIGVLIWGARTLDGNSMDHRYVPVQRSLICVEESIRQGLAPYVFEPNDANTWQNVRSQLENFLTTLWQQGMLQGAKPDYAFSVNVGLGSTMTSDDILNGQMVVQVMLALVRPAEFIVLTFVQPMASA